MAPRDSGSGDPVASLSLDTPQSFRDTSMLIAIREAGLVCADIVAADLAAEASDDDSGTGGPTAWRVVCDGAFVYLVGFDDAGNPSVDPVPYGEGYRYFDPEAPPLWLEQWGQPPRWIEQRVPR